MDGTENTLTYRGYPVQELAGRCSFPAIAYLLVYAELPNRWGGKTSTTSKVVSSGGMNFSIQRRQASAAHVMHYINLEGVLDHQPVGHLLLVPFLGSISR